MKPHQMLGSIFQDRFMQVGQMFSRGVLRFMKSEEGASIIEYVLVGSLIANFFFIGFLVFNKMI